MQNVWITKSNSWKQSSCKNQTRIRKTKLNKQVKAKKIQVLCIY